jgi:tRNA/rRNA methyltransferase
MPDAPPPPAIILVRPQLGMNIGMAARAMGNFALDTLRLVAPRDGWPNPEAGPPAAGADHVLDAIVVHDDVVGAFEGCALTFATTMRGRDMVKPVVTPREAAAMMREAAARGQRSGILFGPERSGLTADDLAPVQTIVTCPVNPGFGSLNLAQAVLLMGYEWFQAGDPAQLPPADHVPAPHEEVAGLIAHLETALDEAGYFHVPDRTPATRRTLAHMLTRPQFSAQEVRTLRGIIRALSELRRKRA